MKRNRWLIAASAVGIHISIGSVYAWSVLARPVMEALSISLAQATWAFSVAILFLGFSAAFLGRAVERIGPRASGTVSALFFGAGMIGTALAVSLKSVALLYFFYGCIGGIGLGVGYITPVATLVKWFPARRGFATGLAIMGFGFASLIAGPVMQFLTETFGLFENFLILGISYAVIMCLSAWYLAPPRPGEIKEIENTPSKTSAAIRPRHRQYTRNEAVRTWRFWALWWIFFTNITCGIGLLAVASPMAQEVIGMNAEKAASLVGIIGVINGAGRIGWAAISDRIGRGSVYVLFFLLEAVSFTILADTRSEAFFYLLVLGIVSCYGGGFSCMPAYLADLFGVRQLSSIHGSILTAWGLAGIAGPVLLAFMKEETGNYATTLRLFAALLTIAFFVALLLRGTQKSIKSFTPEINDGC